MLSIQYANIYQPFPAMRLLEAHSASFVGHGFSEHAEVYRASASAEGGVLAHDSFAHALI